MWRVLTICGHNRYWDGDNWLPRSEFLCAVSLVDKSAEGMYQMLLAVLNALDIPISKMAAICTDGDSTLIGRHNGLGAKLRNTVGYLLSVHCAAHKTALAVGDTAKEMEALQELDFVLKSVHNMFSKSGSRQTQWARFAKKRGVTKLQFPLFNATRWFSRAQCVDALQENLATLILFLKKKSGKRGWEKATALHKALTDVTFICLLHSVADVLQPLEDFRKYFEQDNNLPYKIPGRLEVCLSALKAICGSEERVGDDKLKQFLKSLQEKGVGKELVWKVNENCRIPLVGHSGFSVEHIYVFVKELTGEIEANLLERFPEGDVLSAFKIFDPAFYRSLKQSDLDKFGVSDYKILLSHFCNKKKKDQLFPVDPSVLSHVNKEFSRMKHLLWLAARDPHADFFPVWRDIHDEHGLGLGYILKFVYLCVVIPLNSAIAERGFSLHNSIKTKLRNRLRIITIDALIRCKTLAQSWENFDYLQLEDLYHNKPQNFRLPALFQAVNAIEFDGNTDDGDSVDLDQELEENDPDEHAFYDPNSSEDDEVLVQAVVVEEPIGVELGEDFLELLGMGTS